MKNRPIFPAGYLERIANTVNPALLDVGIKLLKDFNNKASIEISYKDGATKLDPATNLDREIEIYLYETIHKAFPEIGFQLEEHPELNDLSKEIICAIDPIDGTRNFTRQLPAFVSQVGFSFNGRPISGHAIDPVLNRLYSGSLAKPATMNGKEIHVSNSSDLETACISVQVSSRRKYWEEEKELIMDIDRSLMFNVAKYRNFSTTGWHLVNIAAGNLDGGVWLTAENPYDVMAGLAILEAAGGNYERFIIAGLKEERMAAGNPEILEKLKKLMLNIS